MCVDWKIRNFEGMRRYNVGRNDFLIVQAFSRLARPVTGGVHKAVRALEIRSGRVVEGTVAVERHDPVGGPADQDRGQRIAVGVRVVRQHAAAHGRVVGVVHVRVVGIAEGHRPIGHRADRHRGRHLAGT